MRSAILVVGALLAGGCARTPPSYPVPEQHGPAGESITLIPELGDFVRAADPGAERYFIKGVKAREGGQWRWTLAEPEFRFVLKNPANRRLTVRFGINDNTFARTGPVTIVFIVNGRELDRVRYTSFGDKTFEKPVPEDWLKGWDENRVLLRILNPWQAPDPGVKLGVVFSEAGLVK